MRPACPRCAQSPDQRLVKLTRAHERHVGLAPTRPHEGMRGAVGTKRRSNEEIKRLMMEWKTGKLHYLLLALEQLHPNDSKYFVDNKLSWADVAVYNRLNALLDHFPDLMDDRKKYPCLQVCHETIGSLKCVHDWVANHPDDYKDTSRYLY